MVDDGQSYRSVSRSSNISKTTLERLYAQWVSLKRPKPYVLKENRGKNHALSSELEQVVCNTLDAKINNGEVVTHKTVQQLAVSVWRTNVDHFLRRQQQKNSLLVFFFLFRRVL